VSAIYKTYRIRSEALAQGLTVTLLNANGTVVQAISDDNTVYTSDEIRLLQRAEVKMDKAVHLVKHFFCGTIVKIGDTQ